MLIPLLILAMAGQTPTNPSDRGKALFSDCQAQVRLSDANNIGEPPEYQDAASCAGYIDGYTDGVPVNRYFCVEGASLGTLARVYVAYMEKHPKLLDEYKSEGLFDALVDAYPCPVKKN